jgi:hypothetical protein
MRLWLMKSAPQRRAWSARALRQCSTRLQCSLAPLDSEAEIAAENAAPRPAGQAARRQNTPPRTCVVSAPLRQPAKAQGCVLTGQDEEESGGQTDDVELMHGRIHRRALEGVALLGRSRGACGEDGTETWLACNQ